MLSYRDQDQNGKRSSDKQDHGKPQSDGLDNRWSLDRPADEINRGGGPAGGGDPDDNRRQTAAILRSTAVMMAVCMGFALLQPAELLAPLFSTYLFAASGASLVWGVITRPPIQAKHLTHWDQAAFLIAASLFAGFFTDPEAARQAMEAATSGS